MRKSQSPLRLDLVYYTTGIGALGERKTSMYVYEEFLKHAAECERMAKFAPNPASKATWNEMAVRWEQCAERAKPQGSAARYSTTAKPYRRPSAVRAHF